MRVWRADLALGIGLEHASASESALEEVFLGIETADGITALAEVRGNGAYATGADTATILRQTQEIVAPALLNCALDEASQRLGSLPVAPLVSALADSALHDARGRATGQPIWRLLEGRGAASIPVHAQIGFCTAKEAVIRARAAARAGFRRLKLRVGRPSPEADIAVIYAIREAVGERMAIAIDCNGGWDVETAGRVLRAIEPCAVAWAEQPTPAGDDDALRHVRAATVIPIIGDEAIRSGRDIDRLARAGAIDGVHLKLEKAGTVAALIGLVERARAAGLTVFLGQMDQGRLGSSMTTHLAAGIEADAYELWGFQNVTADVATGLDIRDGAMIVPQGAGNGMEVDMTKLELVGEFG
ncbi:mandelate racemase/muconate lactonizing enzyme family protein [Roseovarius spongiae]|nr:mandelate racemase/muconate lactonizing enzyme family protein [Roseovarius spongiae]